MSYHKILVFLTMIYGSISLSYSLSVHSRVKRDSAIPSSAPSNTPSPIPSKSSNLFTWKGWLPLIITCSVLLHIILPFIIRYIYQWFRLKFMDGSKREQLGTFKENIFQDDEDYKSIFSMLSLYCYVSFMLWMAYLICYEVLGLGRLGVVFKGIQIMSIVMMVLCGVYVLIESTIANELEYLENRMEKCEFEAYIEKIRTASPKITLSVECYHFEMRTERITNGSKTTFKRIVTYSESNEFSYGQWKDVSSNDEFPDIKPSEIIRVKIRAFLEFGDEETEQDYKNFKEKISENRIRDRKMDLKEVREILDLKERRLLVYNGVPDDVGWIAKRRYYCLATLLMLTWPYRWLFQANTAKYHYDVKKKLSKCASTPQDIDMGNASYYSPRSNVNPGFPMTELPGNTELLIPANQHSPLQNKANQEPPTNQVPSYDTANHVSPFPAVNQDPASDVFTPNNELSPFPLADQDIPDIPPPDYDKAMYSDY